MNKKLGLWIGVDSNIPLPQAADAKDSTSLVKSVSTNVRGDCFPSVLIIILSVMEVRKCCETILNDFSNHDSEKAEIILMLACTDKLKKYLESKLISLVSIVPGLCYSGLIR